ncbi:MAG: fimbrillin family protein [Bacteroidales bacterium]|nr:fimbrillin family protein [Bacteroidales bacterium]
MKKVLLGTLAVLTLAACSKDEVVQQNPNDAISFTATTGKAISRAADGYCNNDMPDNFQVWANVPVGSGSGYKPYFSGDQFDRDGSTKNYLNNGEYRYWPNSAINFFACKNASKASAFEPEWKSDYSTLVVEDFTVEDDVDKQVDFIYAVQNVAAKPDDGQTTINFRHALSQIEFQARNENTKLYVEISGVSVCKVKNRGTFTFPETSTEDKVGQHNSGSYGDDVSLKVHGEWSDPTTPADIKTYSITTRKDDDSDGEVKKIAGNNTPTNISLTATDPSSQEYNKNTMYLLPQTLTAWAPSAGHKAEDQDNAYFLVKCKIFNVANPATGYQQATDVLLWPATDTYADVAIPFSATWEAGKRYVYTFVFTDKGNGGYDPDNSKDVLVPIKLDVTVDDFVKGADKDVNME